MEEETILDKHGTLAVNNNLRNLDVLRAFAVLTVAGAHLFVYCGNSPRFAVFNDKFGIGGVLFFFVHTSLVLFLSMERTNAVHLTRGFYIRRAFRIYPLCWACIILVLLTGLTDVAHEKIVQMGWRGILVNLALVQNAIRFPNIEMPLWSLPWEVQMYLFLPAFYLFMKKYDRAFVPLAMWFVATALAITFTTPYFPRAFHFVVFPPMFIGGMIAFRLRRVVQMRIPSFLWPPAILGLMLARCMMLQGYSIELTHNAAVNAVTCLLLGLGIPLFREVRARWVTYSAEQIAKYSYGIYLLHIPSLALVFGHFPALPLLLKIVAFIVITGAASVISYHLLEHPLIQLGRSVAKKLG